MKSAVILAAALFAALACSAQHLHFIAGAPNTNQGARLLPVNSNDFVHTSEYVRTLLYASSGTFAGVYSATCPFIVAAATAPFGGPEPGAPALGSFIETEFVSVTGPAGGAIGYWEAGQTNGPNFTIPVGATSATNRFPISEASLGAGQPGADPFGHVHGRRFSANLPGFYTLGFRFIDTSTNGLAGGPIHAPSDIHYVYLQAGICIRSIEPQNNAMEITYGTRIGRDYYVEFSQSLSNGSAWSDISGPTAGNDHLQNVTHHNAGPGSGFYRVREELAPEE